MRLCALLRLCVVLCFSAAAGAAVPLLLPVLLLCITAATAGVQLCFDFIESEADRQLYSIESNPRTSTVITQFHDCPDLATGVLLRQQCVSGGRHRASDEACVSGLPTTLSLLGPAGPEAFWSNSCKTCSEAPQTAVSFLCTC